MKWKNQRMQKKYVILICVGITLLVGMFLLGMYKETKAIKTDMPVKPTPIVLTPTPTMIPEE